MKHSEKIQYLLNPNGIYLKKRVKKNAQNINDSSEDDSSDSEKEIEYDETETSSLVKCNDIAVIQTSDDFPYYLVKLKKDLFLTDSNTKDDHGQTFPTMIKIIVGNYYEHFKQVNESELYYLDQTKTAVISCFSVVGVCPELSEIEQNRWGKMNKWVL